MNRVPKEWLDFLREQFPQGSRVKLREIRDKDCPLELWSMGTLKDIDSAGNFQVDWDCGYSMNLTLGEDKFTVLLRPLQTLKLYAPIAARIDKLDGYGDTEKQPPFMNGYELAGWENAIRSVMISRRAPEEGERGLMYWYNKEDAVNNKVRSALLTVEVRDGQLWGVAECQVMETLTPIELDSLTDYMIYQMTYGWGGDLKQDPIGVNGCDLYVYLRRGEDWSLMTERDRFDPFFQERLPDVCWSTLPSDGSLIRVVRGENGYHMTADSGEKPELNRRMADDRNRCRGISKAQEQAMLNGSLFGWDHPDADPRTCTQGTIQMGGLNI